MRLRTLPKRRGLLMVGGLKAATVHTEVAGAMRSFGKGSYPLTLR
jgi:hypothetical protein